MRSSRGILEKFLQTYDPADDAAVWFDKVKALTAEAGFCADMKAYKAILRHGPAPWQTFRRSCALP